MSATKLATTLQRTSSASTSAGRNTPRSNTLRQFPKAFDNLTAQQHSEIAHNLNYDLPREVKIARLALFLTCGLAAVFPRIRENALTNLS